MRSRSNPPALETFIGPFIIAEGGWREHALVGDRHGHDHLCAGLHAQEYVTISDSNCSHYSVFTNMVLLVSQVLPAIASHRGHAGRLHPLCYCKSGLLCSCSTSSPLRMPFPGYLRLRETHR